MAAPLLVARTEYVEAVASRPGLIVAGDNAIAYRVSLALGLSVSTLRLPYAWQKFPCVAWSEQTDPAPYGLVRYQDVRIATNSAAHRSPSRRLNGNEGNMPQRFFTEVRGEVQGRFEQLDGGVLVALRWASRRFPFEYRLAKL